MTFNPGDKVRHRVMGWTGTVTAYHRVNNTYTVNGSNGISVRVPAEWLTNLDNGGAMATFLFCLTVTFVIAFAVLRGAM